MRRLSLAATALLALALPAVAGVEASTATLTLEQRVERLEKQAAGAQKRPTGPALSLQSADGDLELRFGMHLQTDGRFYSAPLGSADTFLVRRARPILAGRLYDDYSFLLVPDFGSGTTALYDAYFDVRPFDWAGLRLGKFKPPIGLERLQADSELVFAERGLPSDLIPQRDVGAQLAGEWWGGAAAYQLSLTNGAADGTISDTASNGSKEGVLRLFFKPFLKELGPWQGLGVGLAGTYAGNGALPPGYKTSSGQQTFFSYSAGTSPAGEHSRLVPQMNCYWHRLGFFGEYVQENQKMGLTSGVKRHLTHQAWQAVGSLSLTGEDEGYRGLTPRRPLDPKAGAWGALELVARYDQLELDRDTFDFGYASPASSARKATSYAAGLNWYLNKVVKLTADFEQTWFSGGAGTGNRPIERVVLARSQLAF